MYQWSYYKHRRRMGSKPDIKSAAISTPGSDIRAAFRTSLVEISAHQASVGVIQDFTS
jgi:hypothetical protein